MMDAMNCLKVINLFSFISFVKFKMLYHNINQFFENLLMFLCFKSPRFLLIHNNIYHEGLRKFTPHVQQNTYIAIRPKSSPLGKDEEAGTKYKNTQRTKRTKTRELRHEHGHSLALNIRIQVEGIMCWHPPLNLFLVLFKEGGHLSDFPDQVCQLCTNL